MTASGKCQPTHEYNILLTGTGLRLQISTKAGKVSIRVVPQETQNRREVEME